MSDIEVPVNGPNKPIEDNADVEGMRNRITELEASNATLKASNEKLSKTVETKDAKIADLNKFIADRLTSSPNTPNSEPVSFKARYSKLIKEGF